MCSSLLIKVNFFGSCSPYCVVFILFYFCTKFINGSNTGTGTLATYWLCCDSGAIVRVCECTKWEWSVEVVLHPHHHHHSDMRNDLYLSITVLSRQLYKVIYLHLDIFFVLEVSETCRKNFHPRYGFYTQVAQCICGEWNFSEDCSLKRGYVSCPL